MKKYKSLGFTLIELLVVIAIIGILAAVVLASLNDARSSGSSASVKQSLANAKSQAEIVYNQQNYTYATVCDDTKIQQLVNAAATAGNLDTDGGTFESSGTQSVAGDWNVAICHSDTSGWVVSAPLAESTSGTPAIWCTDSTGFSGQDTAVGATDLTCN